MSIKDHSEHSKKTKAGIKRARRAGGGKSGNPFLVGTADDGGELRRKIEKRKKEEADKFASMYREEIKKMRDNGASYSGVARDFNARGIETRRGKKWTPTTVKNVLNRPLSDFEDSIKKLKEAAPWR
jgi:DNA invertase Pin-like site-specific DNA recombinase